MQMQVPNLDQAYGVNTVHRCFTTRASGELSYRHSVFFWLRGDGNNSRLVADPCSIGGCLGTATVESLYSLWLYV